MNYFIYNFDGYWVEDYEGEANRFWSVSEAKKFIEKNFTPDQWEGLVIIYATEFHRVSAKTKTLKKDCPF